MNVNGFNLTLKGSHVLLDGVSYFIVTLEQGENLIVLYKSETNELANFDVVLSTKAWGFLFAKALEATTEVQFNVVPTTIVKGGNND
jgi:hypothetical protein